MVLNNIMGRQKSTQPTLIDCEGTYVTKPEEIANYLNDFFSSKIQKLRKEISYVTENNSTIFNIKNYMSVSPVSRCLVFCSPCFLMPIFGYVPVPVFIGSLLVNRIFMALRQVCSVQLF